MTKKIREILRDPRYVEFQNRYYDNLVAYVLDNSRYQPTWQQMEFLEAVSKPGCRVAVSSGHGCFGKGTPVLMFDGTVKSVEAIQVGDLLMGDDGAPRRVLDLCRGQENLYRFTFMDGTEHVYNESHILCLVATQTHGTQRTGDKIEVTVRERQTWSERKQRSHAAYRTGCDFPSCPDSELLIPPYILGVWLGDGSRRSAEISNPEPEIQAAIYEYAAQCGYGVKVPRPDHLFLTNNGKQTGGFNEKLRRLGIWEAKAIPHCYLCASRANRLELLAGLLDTDGTLDARSKRVLSIVQKLENLADEIVFLARSLGIHASKKKIHKKCCNTGAEGDYFQVNLTRNIEIIPLRVPRKRPDASGWKQRGNLHFGIRSVEPLGMGDYYGFEIDGNRRFLSGDFMVLHNTGKSAMLAWILDWHLRVFHFSNAMLTATNIEQARSVVWKYLDDVIADVESMYPWQAGYFVKETRRYFSVLHKDSWYVMPKTASKAKPENLAGQHNINYLVVVDEASGVDDVIHDVLKGALTNERNRYVMTSQPTRATGHFAEAMTKLAVREGSENGIYTAITMNSELSPLVSKRFIRDKLIEYGGHHSPEYQIRVLGNLPDNLSGYLIPRSWCVQCVSNKIIHEEAWGWVLLADVAEGVHRDSSVMTICRVSGSGPRRMVETVSCDEYLDLDEKRFARRIAAKYHELPALTIAVDADGAGRTVVLELEEMGIPVSRIHWGLPCHAAADQRRYVNLRAYAHCKLREAIFEERFRGPDLKKFVEQASRLPYKIDERGRYQMLPKDQMKAQGIKSPDISDTCCFAFIVDYIPAGRDAATVGEEAELLRIARELSLLRDGEETKSLA